MVCALDAQESNRRSPGSTRVNQYYRDMVHLGNVTPIPEWDEAGNAQDFLNDPNTKASMDAAGVTGDQWWWQSNRWRNAILHLTAGFRFLNGLEMTRTRQARGTPPNEGLYPYKFVVWRL